jgi:hypothetical protein
MSFLLDTNICSEHLTRIAMVSLDSLLSRLVK